MSPDGSGEAVGDPGEKSTPWLNADLAVPRDPVRESQELMAAVGRIVVGAAAVEVLVAVLVAVTEGHRAQAAENRALQLVHKDGAPVRELRKLAAGPPERRDLRWRCALRQGPGRL